MAKRHATEPPPYPELSAPNGLKSGPALIHSYVRFINMSPRVVDISWINHSGQIVRYATLKNRQWIRINTFVGHPWLFRDQVNGAPLVCLPDRLPVYNPVEPPDENPLQLVTVVIILPIYTLADRCLQVIRENAHGDISELEIPGVLHQDIQKHIQLAERHSEERQRLYLPPVVVQHIQAQHQLLLHHIFHNAHQAMANAAANPENPNENNNENEPEH